MNIIITVPKTIKWSEYLKEIEKCRDYKEVMNFKVGDRCYVTHNGIVKGWMEVVGFSTRGFDCTTTGQDWSDGNYVQRSGEFHGIESVEMKGFQSYRYCDEF